MTARAINSSRGTTSRSGGASRRGISILAAAILAACGGAGRVTSPVTPTPPEPAATSFPGFDIANYPGTAALQAWKYPSSPFRWVGYYLPAPCHRDTSWSGRLPEITALGWGVTAIYVGQQDWSQIPADVAPLASRASASVATEQLVTCSASLLSAAQGTAEAADAVARMRANGFPDKSVIFLDVEYVTRVTPALLEYYRAWIAGVLADGRYRVGVYAAKSNAAALYDAAIAEYHGARGNPMFWIASSAGFSMSRQPSDVGFSFAQLWQGMFDVAQQYNGVRLLIDVDVATTPSPSAP